MNILKKTLKNHCYSRNFAHSEQDCSLPICAIFQAIYGVVLNIACHWTNHVSSKVDQIVPGFSFISRQGVAFHSALTVFVCIRL